MSKDETEKEPMSVSLMPTVRGMVRTWRIHFESGINSNAVEDDMVRIISQLLRSPDITGSEVWPESADIVYRWREYSAGSTMRELELQLFRVHRLIEVDIQAARTHLDSARQLVSDWVLAT